MVEGPGVSTRGTSHGTGVDPAMLAGLDRRELARQFLSGLAFLHGQQVCLCRERCGAFVVLVP